MISQDTARHLLGTHARDPRGDELGMIDAIYVDDRTARPEFAAVRLSEAAPSLVPLARAREHDGVLLVAYTREQVRDAPAVDAGEALSDDDLARLCAHYALEDTGAPTDEDTALVHRRADSAEGAPGGR